MQYRFPEEALTDSDHDRRSSIVTGEVVNRVLASIDGVLGGISDAQLLGSLLRVNGEAIPVLMHLVPKRFCGVRYPGKPFDALAFKSGSRLAQLLNFIARAEGVLPKSAAYWMISGLRWWNLEKGICQYKLRATNIS